MCKRENPSRAMPVVGASGTEYAVSWWTSAQPIDMLGPPGTFEEGQRLVVGVVILRDEDGKPYATGFLQQEFQNHLVFLYLSSVRARALSLSLQNHLVFLYLSSVRARALSLSLQPPSHCPLLPFLEVQGICAGVCAASVV